jgi:hypothetical protein
MTTGGVFSIFELGLRWLAASKHDLVIPLGWVLPLGYQIF